MASNTIIFALLVVGALGTAVPEAARYPAGIDPHVCPNYPNCDNVAIAAHASIPTQYMAPSPTYGHQAAPLPAGVDGRVCPNYPYCGPTPVQAQSAYPSWSAPAVTQAAPQPTWSNPSSQSFWANPSAPRAAVPSFSWEGPAQSPSTKQGGALFPAGVDPSSCPNYPYCH